MNVSTAAMVILMLFNDVAEGDTLSFQDIHNATTIPSNDLKRHLQSLACAKFKILTKDPKSRDVSETDRFSFNSGFQSTLARIKIMTVAAAKVENNDERKETMEKVEETRKHQTEAAIVRIMKYTHWLLSHLIVDNGKLWIIIISLRRLPHNCHPDFRLLLV